MGGFDTSLFVEGQLKADFICPVCRLVFDKPFIVCAEGHLLCEGCLTEWKLRSSSCPQCRTQMHSVPVLCRIGQNVIMGLKVKCPESLLEPEAKRPKRSKTRKCNRKMLHCGWEGTLSEYVDKHKVKECKFAQVKCECGKMLVAFALEEHKSNECSWRHVTCELCDASMRHCRLADHSAEYCPKSLVKCDGCGQEMERQVLGKKWEFADDCDSYSEHLEECPKLRIRCPFHGIGCSAELARKDMKQHHADCGEEHAKLVASELRTLRREKHWTEQTIVWKIRKLRLRQLRHYGNLVLKSESVTTGCYQPYLRLKLDQTSGAIIVHVCIKDYVAIPRIYELQIKWDELNPNRLDPGLGALDLIMKKDEDEAHVASAGGTMEFYPPEDSDSDEDSSNFSQVTIDDILNDPNFTGNEVKLIAEFKLYSPRKVTVKEAR